MKRSTLLLLLLTGCRSDPGLDDLKQFIAEVKQNLPPPPPPLPAPKVVKPVAFEVGGRDPFAPATIPSLAGEGSTGSVKPDLNRPREPLERFDLDALVFVGTIQRGDQIFALIKDPEGRVHTVRRGNHLGRNFGQIVAIYEYKIDIKEIIPEAPGKWRERLVTLELGERS